MSVIVKRVENDFELQGILDLQQANLRINIGADTAASQGFLTAEYTLAFLKAGIAFGSSSFMIRSTKSLSVSGSSAPAL